jgi:DNA polymerase I-like protein with 3'-5' exonuclease and polymerase domains
MKVLGIDVETTVQRKEKGLDNSPFNPDNYLVSCGIQWLDSELGEYYFFKHNELDVDPLIGRKAVQDAINEADLLVGHNIKYDLLWLTETGFTIDCPVYCTMIGEYLLARGQKMPLSLAETSKRRQVTLKRSDLMEDTFKKGIGYEAMDPSIVEEYGRADVLSCLEVYESQLSDYRKPEFIGLRKVREMMNEMLLVLLEMERNGIYIDMQELASVEKEFAQEKNILEKRLYEIAQSVMGDTPVNLNSSEQLSTVIYSRSVNDKAKWREVFNIGVNAVGKKLPRPRMDAKEFARTVKENSSIVFRTHAQQCIKCKGYGYVQLYKKDGGPRKNKNRCDACGTKGMIYLKTDKVAGFKLTPSSPQDASANGFSTDKGTLQFLLAQAHRKKLLDAVEFLQGMRRLNALSVYLTSFCGGIERNTRKNNVLHTTFNQCITATGRLSSSDPNFQNQPRSGTFPIRKCVVSRFDGGEIMEADFAGLEFRVAGELSKDPQIYEDVVTGKDVHKQTASIINQKPPEEISKEERQGAKAYTFAPLYGGQGGAEPPHIQKYFKEYFNIYEGLSTWHDTLKKGVLRNGLVTLPSGRQFYWPNVERMPNGRVSYATQIVNYPVQSFATADIVPLACIRVHKLMRDRKVKSLCVLTVHDSIVVDVHPDEKDIVKEILIDAMENVAKEVKVRFNYEMVIPLAIEIKSGSNWLNGNVIYG